MTFPVAILYVEELKAAMRGRFAWLGAAVILLAIGGLATVATQDTWLDGYGIIAYFLVPLGFIPLAAGAIATPRANRFVESVFTAPVERSNWLAAKVLVQFTLAGAYYLALVPMMLVYTYHVGLPLLLGKFLIWTVGILIASIGVGTLIGVLFTGRSIAAPAATGMGVLLAYAGLVPLQELMVAQGNGATRIGHLALLSPAALLKNALGFTLVAGSIPVTTTRTWISLLVVTIGVFALAMWIFIRAQGVETWEATRSQRWIVTLAIVAIARALMGDPKVLFLDEPTRGLDLPAKHETWKLLRDLAAQEQVTTFLSSHDAQEIRSLCSEVSIIARGKLVYTGATHELGANLDVFEERLIELLTHR